MRFRVATLYRGTLENEDFYPNISGVKSWINHLKRNKPEFIRSRDIWVEDTKENVEYHVDQNYQLVLM